MALGMHSSETLNNEVFGSQPNRHDLELTRKIESMLAQYSVDATAAEAIASSRIPDLLKESKELSRGTAGELARLRAELIVANGIGEYYVKPSAVLEEKNKGRIAEILAGTASNDDRFEAAA